MASQISPNEMIVYTKWLTKWVLIIIFILSALGISAWGIFWFIQSKIPMIAIQCEGEQIRSVKEKLELYYLVQKKRFSDVPFGVYFGANTRKDFHVKTDVQDIVLGSELTKTTDTHYHFGGGNNSLSYRIARKTLFVETFDIDNQKFTDGFPIKRCIEISTEQFYDKTGEEVKRRKKELRF